MKILPNWNAQGEKKKQFKEILEKESDIAVTVLGHMRKGIEGLVLT